ncbi:peptide-N(4)-(N-acetyl-beta-glucosaminyl)asparagine amidase-like [Oppia nitens]|uniref:peptide-N(4)-(N-acetyl-beta- glucosaminyl)asparagine amidase-like n=1 Tax=Oppia nitens TaxID=1686743 RepID=UPI0023D9B947|nr:peptide-N(4)-(N-acetyl-beta-glucosaminyl)asparagine amidase-like [Oppia nitens]
MSIIPTFLRSDTNLMPVNDSEQQFFAKIKSYLNLVKFYEDVRVQELVRDVVPWKQLTINAINKMIQLKQSINCDDKDIGTDSKDLLLIDLIHWFKNEFFEWFDSAVCDKCNKTMTSSSITPNTEELFWNAMTVELYNCSDCGQTYRFPRYNNPEKLLITRKGRCGEWANCFTLICRALNYEARLVVDWTDHVWTEVYSNAQKRWLHCDPCEDICDSPLVYECGWKKTLTFCIAFAYNEVQDVSWRYSNDHSAIRLRRALSCREEWLSNVLNKVTNNLQLGLTSPQREQLKLRRLLEFVEFLRVPNQQNNVNQTEAKGRQSGSQAWRLARQEITEQQLSDHFVFELTDPSINPTLITYNCSADEYKFNAKIVKSWKKCVFDCENIMRKVEKDWKMCYLSRIETNDWSPSDNKVGKISWKLRFNDDFDWSEMRITFRCKVFENGRILLFLYSKTKDTFIEITANNENIVKKSELPFAVIENELILETILEGGVGKNGWQHSQLFRQSLTNEFF